MNLGECTFTTSCRDEAIALVANMPDDDGIQQFFPICDWHVNVLLERSAEES